MRRLLALLLLLPAPLHAFAPSQSPVALSTVRQVVALTNAQATQGLQVRLEATITYLEPQDSSMFVQDDGAGIYVNFSADTGLIPGDRVLVTGVTHASFLPEINAKDVHFLAHGSLPTPREVSFPT